MPTDLGRNLARVYKFTLKISKKLRRGMDPNWILLDPGSQIHLFRSRRAVKNIRKTPFPIKVTGVSPDPFYVDHVADHDDFGIVYFSEKSTANIVSFAELETQFSVDQVKDNKDTTAGYVATHRKTGTKLVFKRTAGLLVYYGVNLPTEARSYINTVKLRKQKYTKREIAKADLAHIIRERMGWPSTATMKKIINTGGILNMPITSKDVDRDLDIYGRSYADAAGKFT